MKTEKKHFLLFVVGVMFSQCAVHGIYTATSSLNVEEGLGTTSFALAYGVSLVLLFFTPGLVKLFGAKKILLAAEICYFPFIVGNIYTSYYTVLPAGFFLGLAEATFWPTISLITAYFAKTFTTKDEADIDKKRSYYAGRLFACVQAGAVFGNGTCSIFLFVDRTLSKRGNFTQNHDYTFCGANDCQIQNVTNANLEQYKPAYPATRYALIGFSSLLLVVAFVLQAAYLPNDISTETEADKNAFKSCHNLQDNQQGYAVSKTLHDRKMESCLDAELKNNLVLEVDGSQSKILFGAAKTDETKRKINRKKSAKSAIVFSLQSMMKLFIRPKHLLVMWLPFYDGMLISFIYGELTRSYASCVLGVDKVGICIVLSAISDSMFSLFAGKLAGKYGRNIPFALAFTVDIITYTVCLRWHITADYTWAIYALFISFGIADGVWQVLINELYGNYFKDVEETAYSVWNLMTMFGFIIQFSISTRLCIYHKLYLQMGLLCFAILLYGISYWHYVYHATTKTRTVTDDVHAKVKLRIVGSKEDFS